MDEVPPGPACLPDPAVWLLPAPDRGLDEIQEEHPVGVVRRVAAAMPAPEEVHELSVGVQLELLRGSVAGADRARTPVAGEVQFLFPEAALAAWAIKDL